MSSLTLSPKLYVPARNNTPNASQAMIASHDPRPHNGGLEKAIHERRNHDRAIRVIFLDIDGVLNNVRQKDAMSIDNNCLKLFAELVIKTSSYIVMSSTWRKHPAFMDFLLIKFRALNIEDRLIGKTSVIGDFERVAEISAWIKRFEKKYSFPLDGWVAIDDMHLDAHDETPNKIMRGHFVLTTMKEGFTRQSQKQAENLLLNKPDKITINGGGKRRKSWTEFLFREVIGGRS